MGMNGEDWLSDPKESIIVNCVSAFQGEKGSQSQEEKRGRALGDVRVLDLASCIGLYCTKLLAELGADVIRIEPPSGDPARRIGPFYHDDADAEKSLYFFHFNANKRSITLNLHTADGRDIFGRLARTADVIVETFRPGYLEGLGLGYEKLSKINPGLIFTSITPFGQDGPYRDYKACDITGVAMGGLMWLSGFPESPPNYLGGYQGYHLASVNGAMGTLAALCCRDMTGEGQHVDVSMHESVVPATEVSVVAYTTRKIVRKRSGRQVYRGWNELYPCKDGHVMCSPFGGARWRKMLDWAESEGMAADLKDEKCQDLLEIMADVQMDRQVSGGQRDPRTLIGREREIAHVEQIWEEFLLTHTREELYERSQSMGVRLMPVYTAADQLKDPQLLARNWFTPVAHPELGETLTYSGPPYRLSLTPWQIWRRAPFIGEHNIEIYEGELGFSREELLILKQGGVI